MNVHDLTPTIQLLANSYNAIQSARLNSKIKSWERLLDWVRFNMSRDEVEIFCGDEQGRLDRIERIHEKLKQLREQLRSFKQPT